MNTHGDLVGYAGDYHAVLWPREGGIRDLHSQGLGSVALAINDHKMVVGSVTFPDRGQAFWWLPFVGMQLLPRPAGLHHTMAYGVNASGVIVGIGLQSWGDRGRALLWEGGQVADLNTRIVTPGWLLEHALALNDAGQITGYGQIHGVVHGFLLSPLPPPPVALTLSVQGDFNADGHLDQAGLTSEGAIWRRLTGAPWEQLEGLATSLIVGDLDGNGTDDLVALASDYRVFAMTNLTTWQWTQGWLSSLAVDRTGPVDILYGHGLDGRLWWYAANEQRWYPLADGMQMAQQ
jgi:hypothetical protein